MITDLGDMASENGCDKYFSLINVFWVFFSHQNLIFILLSVLERSHNAWVDQQVNSAIIFSLDLSNCENCMVPVDGSYGSGTLLSMGGDYEGCSTSFKNGLIYEIYK